MSKYLVLLLLAGCATCREHPAQCAVAAGVVVVSGAVIASSNSHSIQPPAFQMRGWYTK